MSDNQSLSASKVLVKFRFKRFLNQMAGMFKKKPKPGQARTATARKALTGWFGGLFIGCVILMSAFSQSSTGIDKVFDSLSQVQIVEEGKEIYPAWNCAKSKWHKEKNKIECRPAVIGEQSRVAAAILKVMGLEFLFLFLTVLLMGIASKELASPEWDLEWLYTLPIPFSTLISSRVAERTLVNPIGLLLFWPFSSMYIWKLGFGWWSLLYGMFITLVLSLLTAILRTIVDTGLRLIMSPSKLRNLQAIMSIVSSVFLLLAMSPTLQDESFIVRWGMGTPNWFDWTPFGISASLFAQTSASSAIPQIAMILVQSIALYILAYAFLKSILAKGVVSGGGRESQKRAVLSSSDVKKKKSIFTVIQLKELKLLARDRNFLVQTLVLPGLIVGMQIFISDTSKVEEWFSGSFSKIAAIAFGVASYSLMFSAFQILNSEGKSLWMLYTFPQKLEDQFKEKLMLWLGVSILYPVLIFSSSLYFKGTPTPHDSLLMVITVAGVLIYSVVAACLGVFASDPLAEDPRHRSRVDFMYLYMVLAGFYTYAIFAESIWQKLPLIVLSSLMALALWQKARDYLPYLLDPTASPKSEVSLSDGLIAALIFFVLQGISSVFMSLGDKELTGKEVAIAFSIAGFVTYLALRLIYWRKGTSGVPKVFGEPLSRVLRWGIGFGLIAALVGYGYLFAALENDWFTESLKQVQVKQNQETWWLFGLLVIAAPLFEEFIFRGLIFNGLNRTWGIIGGAFASAAVFAIVHPPVAVVPVFILGLLTAISYAKTNALATPILVHGIYNFAIFVSNRVLFS